MSAKKKVLVGLASLTLFDISAATAADFPVKAPPRPPAPLYDWSGFYIGGHAGYRWADASFSGSGYTVQSFPGFGTGDVPASNASFRPNGGLVGVQAGVNFMISPSVLAGFEGDWSWASAKRSIASTVAGELTDGLGFISQSAPELELTWQATIRGRLGVVNGPWLFYGTAGVAFIHARWSETAALIFEDLVPPRAATWTDRKTLAGFVGGVGIEYMYAANWIGRIEYLYENFGDFDVRHSIVLQTGKLDIGDVHKLRVAISYKFSP
jgi:opacity protein-like surface antigen